jgi:hypothetical protein
MPRPYPENPYQSLEEARKSWDYFISNEIVYEGKGINAHRVEGISWVYSYRMGDIWFEVCATKGQEFGIALIIENHDTCSAVSGQGNIRTNVAWRNDAMFVGVREKLQISKEVEFRPISSIVWLKAFDFTMCSWQDKFKCSPLSNGLVQSRHIVIQGELNCLGLVTSECLPTRFTNVQQGEAPRNMVQGGSEISNNVTNNETPTLGSERRVNIHINQLSRAVQYGLFPDGTLWVERTPHTTFKGVDVYVRPINLELGATEWFHMLYSNHEREEDAKDAQGSRDTHTKPRGLSKEPRPSGENPQETITASTLSEPKLETERDHPRGDYTAKHTHIDSLEDA